MDRVSTLLLVQSTASTAAGRRDKHIGTKHLLTPAMSANILILVKVTHITCCCRYYICKALALAEFTFEWRCTLFVALRNKQVQLHNRRATE
jgi:hypothetical protein